MNDATVAAVLDERLDTTCWPSLDNESCACCPDRPDGYELLAALTAAGYAVVKVDEIRRLQRALINANVLTHCEDLCMVVCAGPCQGVNTDE